MTVFKIRQITHILRVNNHEWKILGGRLESFVSFYGITQEVLNLVLSSKIRIFIAIRNGALSDKVHNICFLTHAKQRVPVTGPVVAQRVGRVIALLFQDHGTRRGWVVSSTPRPYFTPWEDPVPIVYEAGWAPGPVWTGRKSRSTGIRSPDRPARSQSLYRLTQNSEVF